MPPYHATYPYKRPESDHVWWYRHKMIVAFVPNIYAISVIDIFNRSADNILWIRILIFHIQTLVLLADVHLQYGSKSS